jgi:hypothetical protein
MGVKTYVCKEGHEHVGKGLDGRDCPHSRRLPVDGPAEPRVTLLVRGRPVKTRPKCERCGNPLYPDPGHECMLYPEGWMEKLYGPMWRSKFPDYDTRYRDMRVRVREQEVREQEVRE